MMPGSSGRPDSPARQGCRLAACSRPALLRLAVGVLLLDCCSRAAAQSAPAPGPSLAQEVNPTPLFSGQHVNITPSAANMNAVVTAKPQTQQLPTQLAGEPQGLLKLGITNTSRDGYLYVPSNYHVQRPSPFMLCLHAAGKSGLDGLAPLLPFAEAQGVLLLAPDSRLATWDYLNTSTFGPDVAFINASMAAVFGLYRVDPTQLAIQGFSDGATYSLILGITNGVIFDRVIAFSPGGVLSPQPTGKPPIFLSAGDDDDTYGEPADRVAANIDCQLQAQGYPVDFVQFNGGHEVPSSIAYDAGQWFLGPAPTQSNGSATCSR